MANGVLVDEATYFNDNETYTGDSGSETNRYVIEDVYDFVAIGTTTTYKHYRLVNDIDMRDHPVYKNGFDKAKMVHDAYGTFDGDGHLIKNIVLNNYTGSNISNVAFMYFGDICNVDFINLVMINCDANCPLICAWGGGDGLGRLRNCNFGIYVANCSGKSFPFTSSQTEDCCFNIKGRVTDSLYFSVNIKRTHLNLDIIESHSYALNGSNTITFTNCYITGKIKNSGTIGTNNGIFVPKFSNSYIAVEYEGDSHYSGIKITGTGFIDKELWCKNGFTGLSESPGSGYVTPITTAQAQDADYLNSIGFAVIPTNI